MRESSRRNGRAIQSLGPRDDGMRPWRFIICGLMLAFVVAGLAVACATGRPESRPSAIETSPNLAVVATSPNMAVVETRPDLKVAFVADIGTARDAQAVLRLIKRSGADLVLAQGDLVYDDDPEAFAGMVDGILGNDFPFFASLGNHDVETWRESAAWLRDRAARTGAVCEGTVGVKAVCVFDGLTFVTSSAEVLETERAISHADFIRRELGTAPQRWKVCSWHYNQATMQVGGKRDRMGWEIYEACREAGAIIATGHEHSYSRTHLIGKFGDEPVVVATGDTLEVGPGRTIAFVSGLGGASIRVQKRSGDWWASVYTASQGAEFGALFCTFSAGGQHDAADCYFEAVNGDVPDSFRLIHRPSPQASRGY